jgi:choline dehydrogenase-like flavoprotein
MFVSPDETFDPYNEIKFLLKTKSLKSMVKLVANGQSVVSSIHAMLMHNFIYRSEATPQLTLMLEQEPIESSFISLSEDKDQFGVPKASINWDISPLTWETAITLTKYCKEELRRLEFGNLQANKFLVQENENWLDMLSDVNHHMGGARMSATQAEGVVDPIGRVWGLENLYVCSAAIYPSSSFSNPTLTLLALGERMVEHIKNKVPVNLTNKLSTSSS